MLLYMSEGMCIPIVYILQMKTFSYLFHSLFYIIFLFCSQSINFKRETRNENVTIFSGQQYSLDSQRTRIRCIHLLRVLFFLVSFALAAVFLVHGQTTTVSLYLHWPFVQLSLLSLYLFSSETTYPLLAGHHHVQHQTC